MKLDEGGRGAEEFARKDWAGAFAVLVETNGPGGLDAVESARLGVVADLLGDAEESRRAWERAHQLFLAADDPASAVYCVFWLCHGLMHSGEFAQAGGWLARAHRIVEESGVDGPERGYIQIPRGLQLLGEGDPKAAGLIFDEVRALGRRVRDADLHTLGSLGYGRSLINRGDIPEGLTTLDEAMVAVTAGEVSPTVAGIVYCAVVEACEEVFDFRRASEWTDALTRWCEAQPGLVSFRGECHVYRSHLLELRGEWSAGLEAAEEAERRLSGPPMHPALGNAFYRKGELLRLRGSVSDAEEAYRRAEECGRRPEPGRALLRLQQGRLDAAANSIRHSLDEASADPDRAPLLDAAVEIFVAIRDSASAQRASAELQVVAVRLGSPWLRAAAARGSALVSLLEENPHGALHSLGIAVGEFHNCGARYETARTRLYLARAARLAGDRDAAASHAAVARRTFDELGAVPSPVWESGAARPKGDASALTARELEVLRLVSRGLTNRAIASSLTISEKTAANHVANVLGKLGLSSRAAATAFAYENELL